MKFSAIKDIHLQKAMQTTQVQSDFQARWLDANGVNFANGVLGGLLESLNKLSEDAASASVQQQKNELCRNEIEQYINAAKMRDEAQDAKNKEISAELNIPENSIGPILHRARQRLKNR